MASSGGKRVITGFKTFGGKAARFTGKYALKALAKVPELAVRGGSNVVDALANSEQFQVVATTGGLIAASVACPPIALGVGAFALGKMFGDRVLGKTNSRGENKGILEELKDTLLIGNKLTALACTKVISPAMRFVDTKAQEIGTNTQEKINEAFDGR